MRRTREEAEQTRQLLLRAGLDVFGRKGFADTRLEEIAAEAGVTRGAIYHHFGSKADLFNALNVHASSKLDRVIRETIAEGGTPLALLRRLFVSVLVFAATDTEFRAILEMTIFRTGTSDELTDGLKQKAEGNRRMLVLLTDQFRAAQQEELLRAPFAPQEAAFGYLALLNGVLTLWLLDTSLLDLRARAGALIDPFLAGLE